MRKIRKKISASVVVLLVFFITLISINFTSGSPGDNSKKTYTDPIAGYSLDLPANWYIRLSSGSGAATVISNKDLKQADRNRFNIDIVQIDNIDHLNLDQFIIFQDENNLSNLGLKITTNNTRSIISGNKEIIIREITNNLGSWWEAYLIHNNKVYLLSAPRNINFQTNFDEIVKSLRFNNK